MRGILYINNHPSKQTYQGRIEEIWSYVKKNLRQRNLESDGSY